MVSPYECETSPMGMLERRKPGCPGYVLTSMSSPYRPFSTQEFQLDIDFNPSGFSPCTHVCEHENCDPDAEYKFIILKTIAFDHGTDRAKKVTPKHYLESMASAENVKISSKTPYCPGFFLTKKEYAWSE